MPKNESKNRRIKEGHLLLGGFQYRANLVSKWIPQLAKFSPNYNFRLGYFGSWRRLGSFLKPAWASSASKRRPGSSENKLRKELAYKIKKRISKEVKLDFLSFEAGKLSKIQPKNDKKSSKN